MDPTARMRLAVLIPCWKRPRLTALVLAYYAGLQVPGLDLQVVVVTSPGDAHDVPASACHVEHPNEPLGAKWNAGLAACEASGADLVMACGSDDLFDVGYLEHAATLVDLGYDYVGLGSMYFYDLPTGRLAYLRQLNCGAGRVFSSEMLERMGWQAWDPAAHLRTDGSQNRLVRRYARTPTMIRDIASAGLAAVDVKSGFGRQSFEKITGHDNPQSRVAARPFFDAFFPTLSDALTSGSRTLCP